MQIKMLRDTILQKMTLLSKYSFSHASRAPYFIEVEYLSLPIPNASVSASIVTSDLFYSDGDEDVSVLTASGDAEEEVLKDLLKQVDVLLVSAKQSLVTNIEDSRRTLAHHKQRLAEYMELMRHFEEVDYE